ncbi:16S rRNA m(5)C-1407 methyltransferase [Mangrovibacter plantisponsor]|uniref:Ribosomal RNA small subunit methyltransferase F n=1 Tax=Mangrovibacter plantisponsor TaxID=451513 RepID=A0A317PYW0_9ENTR|nr:16S rRNA m(5)C-1407 methyltransferase [Mangrovibacter plantisponsor]
MRQNHQRVPVCRSARGFVLNCRINFVIQGHNVAASHSLFLPPEFLQLMSDTLPGSTTLDTFLEYCAKPLRRSIRVNTLKISVADFLTLTAPYQWQLTPVPWCSEGFWIERDDEDELPLGSTAEHLGGLFYIQEASSMLPVTALLSQCEALPASMMDMAAAPGSKTTQLAACMGNQGFILANEFSSSRVKVLHANLSRCGVINTALTHFDGKVFGAALPETFDAVLLDAPCSGEGVIRKDADALKNWSTDSMHSIAATQRELLESALHALRPGGTLVYSTCTLNRHENQEVCHALLEAFPEQLAVLPLGNLFPGADKALTAEGFLHVFPQYYDSEGFFIACLRKQASLPAPEKPSFKLGTFPFKPASRKDSQSIQQAAAEVGLTWPQSHNLWVRDNELWLFAQDIEPLLNKVRFSRCGIKLAERHNKGVRWQHEAVIALGNASAPNAFEINGEQAQEWYRGRDIFLSNPPQFGEVLVVFQGQVLGLAKKVSSKLKNSFPRELVRDGILFSAAQ